MRGGTPLFARHATVVTFIIHHSSLLISSPLLFHPSSFILPLAMTRPLLMSLFDESERRPLSVSELTSQVRGAVESRFASVWVEGEISNFKSAASGHWYFTVRDEGAQLRATCFRGVNCRIRFRPSDGLLVRVRGRMTVYEPRGEYELMVEALDPVGAGALRVAFEQLKRSEERRV